MSSTWKWLGITFGSIVFLVLIAAVVGVASNAVEEEERADRYAGLLEQRVEQRDAEIASLEEDVADVTRALRSTQEFSDKSENTGDDFRIVIGEVLGICQSSTDASGNYDSPTLANVCDKLTYGSLFAGSEAGGEE